MRPVATAILTFTAIAVGACAPAPRSSSPSSDQPASALAAVERTLVMLARGEPSSLGLRAFSQAGGQSNSFTAFNATLDEVDENGAPRPVLAEALPKLNTDSWRLFSDGRMETTYHLKANLVWHDGVPLAAEDFAFAWRVYATPALGTSSTPPIAHMEEVTAPDSRTIQIRWQRPYPGAAVLRAFSQIEGFQALPRHLVEQAYLSGDADFFVNHPFWTREYVGLGPYQLDRWEPGAAMEGVAFDRFVFGRPHINRIHIAFVTDANTAAANLLSGEAHIALDYLVLYEHGATLQKQWATTNGGIVLFSPLLVRTSVVQLRPETIASPAILDVRFRRALAHGMDRDALNDAFYGGQAIITHGHLSPRSIYYPQVEPMLAKYPYDPRRAQELLEEVSGPRGADGFYPGTDRQPFAMEVMVLANPSQESENAVIVEGYQRLGINAVGRVLPVALFTDGQARASYTGMLTTGGLGFEMDLVRFTAARISRPETRWQGTNYGAWTSSTYESLWQAYNGTLDSSEQVRQLGQMDKIISEELPEIPMFYTPLITPYSASLVGPVLRNARAADNLLDIHKWYWKA